MDITHFNTKTASAYIEQRTGMSLKPGTLRNMRSQGRGPKCRWFGRRPFYVRDDLDTFIAAKTTAVKTARRRTQIDLFETPDPWEVLTPDR
jgi:hypothetical protein